MAKKPPTIIQGSIKDYMVQLEKRGIIAPFINVPLQMTVNDWTVPGVAKLLAVRHVTQKELGSNACDARAVDGAEDGKKRRPNMLGFIFDGKEDGDDTLAYAMSDIIITQEIHARPTLFVRSKRNMYSLKIEIL